MKTERALALEAAFDVVRADLHEALAWLRMPHTSTRVDIAIGRIGIALGTMDELQTEAYSTSDISEAA